MIKVTFPDGNVKEYEAGVTPVEVAKSISEGLARNVISATADGTTSSMNSIRLVIRVYKALLHTRRKKHNTRHQEQHQTTFSQCFFHFLYMILVFYLGFYFEGQN